MIQHAHDKFFTDCLIRSGLSASDQKELSELFAGLTSEQADLFYVILSEDSSWLPKILANYRAKCAAFRERDDRMLEEILKTEISEFE